MNFLVGLPTFRSESCSLESEVLKQKDCDYLVVVFYVRTPFGDFFPISKHMDSKTDVSDLVV